MKEWVMDINYEEAKTLLTKLMTDPNLSEEEKAVAVPAVISKLPKNMVVNLLNWVMDGSNFEDGEDISPEEIGP